MSQPVTKKWWSARRRREQRSSPSSGRTARLASAAIVAVAIVAALIYAGRADDPDVTALDYTGIPTQGNVLGDPDAPVSIVEYADFQCPFCGQFSQEVVPQIVDDFVRTGEASYELRIFPFLGGADLERPGNESIQATEAASCAMDQGKFWPYSDMLFTNQDGENDGAFSDGRLTEFAADAGLDEGAFGTCMSSNAHHQTALDAYASARDGGIRSTPTILINGQAVAYTTQGYDRLREQIEAAIAGKPIPT